METFLLATNIVSRPNMENGQRNVKRMVVSLNAAFMRKLFDIRNFVEIINNIQDKIRSI